MCERKNINAVVARKGNEFYILETVFEHDNGFKGATGLVAVGIEQREYDYRTTDRDELTEYFRDSWKEAVKTDDTELGLEDYVDDMIELEDIEEIIFDSSASEYLEEINEKGFDFVYTDCVGGGRIFLHENDFDEVYRQDLIELIKQYED